MNRINSRISAKIAAALAALSLAAFATAAHASPGHHGPAKLVGTWNVTIITFNCTTKVEGPPFTSLLSFAEGGTMVETTSNPGFAPGQRSIGMGTWQRTGRDRYWATTEAFIQFNSPPSPPPPPFILQFLRGTQRLEQGITMTGRDTWTSEATNSLVNSAGEEYFFGCARAAATRLK